MSHLQNPGLLAGLCMEGQPELLEQRYLEISPLSLVLLAGEAFFDDLDADDNS